MADSRRRANPATARDRGVAPATSKALEIGLVVLYVGFVTAALYGGAVPGYRSAAAETVADRTLAGASQRVEQAIPPNGSSVDARMAVELPDTIRGRPYEVSADGRRLVLEHPHQDVSATTRLALPPPVLEVTGGWSSTEQAAVSVQGSPDGLNVHLERGDGP